jgi:hypothetical protein
VYRGLAAGSQWQQTRGLRPEGKVGTPGGPLGPGPGAGCYRDCQWQAGIRLSGAQAATGAP